MGCGTSLNVVAPYDDDNSNNGGGSAPPPAAPPQKRRRNTVNRKPPPHPPVPPGQHHHQQLPHHHISSGYTADVEFESSSVLPPFKKLHSCKPLIRLDRSFNSDSSSDSNDSNDSKGIHDISGSVRPPPPSPPDTDDLHLEDFSSENDTQAVPFIFVDGIVKKVVLNFREKAFYEALKSGKMPLLTRRNLTPDFFGVETVETRWGIMDYLLLEDLTSGFVHPSVLSIKIGTQSWDDDSSPSQKRRYARRDAETTSLKMGFRFSGMKVFDTINKKTRLYPTNFGWYCADEEKMKAALKEFLFNGKCIRHDVIPMWLEKLEKIAEFIDMGQWKFFSSAVFFVYDDVVGENENFHQPDVRMIDFAHSWKIKDGGKDDNYSTGLVYLQYFLRMIFSSRQDTR